MRSMCNASIQCDCQNNPEYSWKLQNHSMFFWLQPVVVYYLVSGTLVSSCTTALNSFQELCDQYGSTCSLESQPEGQWKLSNTLPCQHQKKTWIWKLHSGWQSEWAATLTFANGGSLVSSWSCIFHLNENSKALTHTRKNSNS